MAMIITKDNLADAIAYFMEDNEVDYLHIRASVTSDGETVKVIICEDFFEGDSFDSDD